MELDKRLETAQAPSGAGQSVPVPRWIIYFQGALLGVVAATFFVFGMMVGSMTQEGTVDAIRSECQVAGQVLYAGQSGDLADDGAVVLLLPRDRQPEKRFKGKSINPNSFEPLSNPAIDFIHASGGAVLRVDERGRFEAYVESPNTYIVLVISRHQVKPAGRALTRAEMAALGSYFSNVEELLGDRDYYWQTRSLDSSEFDLGTIRF